MFLVTGAAGYIGGLIARTLAPDVIGIDDYSNSRPPENPTFKIIRQKIHLVRKTVLDKVDGIVHCAGLISPRDSVHRAADYWSVNVGAAALFFGKAKPGTPVVFSSSCSVYDPGWTPRLFTEHARLGPVSPYGRTKMACEMMIRDLGMKLVSLRYFNVAGGSESHADEIHLIPRAVRAALGGPPLEVYGDGSQVRDFVHVADLARAHVIALKSGLEGTWNLGSGRGYTVREVIDLVGRLAGAPVPVVEKPRHPADPDCAVADIGKISHDLGWKPELTLQDMIQDTIRHLRS